MVITYYGKEFFKIQVGDTVIAFNPISKTGSEKTTKFGADIGFISLKHPDFNGEEQLAHGEKTPFIVRGPGEYEIDNIFITGFSTNVTYAGEKKINTIYALTFEGINLCFLGALGSPESITNDLKAQVGDVDILFVPIGGGDVCEPADAYNKVAVTLEPNIVIPMHYDLKDNKSKKDSALNVFLKEGGSGAEPQEKLTVKKKDLSGKEGDIVVLAPSV